MCRELLKIYPGLLLNVVPIHFDEIVTFAGEEDGKKSRENEMKKKK
jgi:hypothetical protein